VAAVAAVAAVPVDLAVLRQAEAVEVHLVVAEVGTREG
jgi:hypothetical protein